MEQVWQLNCSFDTDNMLHSGSIRIFAVRGVELRLHVSLVLLLLYVITVTSVHFSSIVSYSHVDPGLLFGGPWIWGSVFALGLLVSIGLHEYGHVFVAQSQGIHVKAVTLMVLGGVSEMEKIPEGNHYSELKLALIGPVVSLILSLILYGIQESTQSPNLYLFAYWLGTSNLVLGLFNLIPAFPLDGGRALRSFLETRRGKVRATQISVQVSQAVAWFLGLFGLMGFNWILVLVALFIHATARAEMNLVTIKNIIIGMDVSEFTSPMEPLPGEVSLRQVAAEMLKTQNDTIAVQSGSGEIGILTLADVKRLPPKAWEAVLAREVMHPVSKVLDPKQSMSESLAELLRSPSQALPVGDSNKIVGLVTRSHFEDIVQVQALKSAILPEIPRHTQTRQTKVQKKGGSSDFRETHENKVA